MERAEGVWDALLKGLQDGAAVAVAKAEELTQQSKARLDIAATKARLSRLLAALGVIAYKQLEGGGGDGDTNALEEDPEARSLCEQIRAAEADLAAQMLALRKLKLEADAAGKEDAAGQKDVAGEE